MTRAKQETQLEEPSRRRRRSGQLRPGGRTERVRQAVARATLDLLKSGQTRISVSAIAKSTGVHRTTIHRRWPTRADLVREALTLHTSRFEIRDTGSWESDVHALAQALAKLFSDPAEIAMNTALVTHADPEFNTWSEAHFARVRHLIALPFKRAIARGEIPRNVNATLLTNLLIAPMVAATVFTRSRLERRGVRELADAVIRLSAHQTPPSR